MIDATLLPLNKSSAVLRPRSYRPNRHLAPLRDCMSLREKQLLTVMASRAGFANT